MTKEKPWLRFYESHVPEYINYPNVTLPVALEETALRHPHRPAMVFKGNWFSYQAFDQAVDRKKDMILGAGGYNIYPREIEDVLYEHPKVLEAAAAGVPVSGKGERVKVYVVLKPGQTATEEEIVEFCRENLAPYKVPKFVEFRDDLPKTLVGKILRRALVEEETKHTT